MSTYADRLKALREQLKAEKLDGFVVPLTDEHMSEYVGSYAQRLAWLTGFQGSAGSAVVLPEEAAIFVDGRYTLQVRQQVSPDRMELSVGPRDEHHAMARGACPRRRAHRLRSVAPHARLGKEGEGSARHPRRGAGRRSIVIRSTRSGTTGPKPRRRTSSSSPTNMPASRRPRSGPRLATGSSSITPMRRSSRRSIRSPGRSTSAAPTSPTRRSRSLMRSSMPTAPPTCSSPARRSGLTSASISAMASACTSAPSSRASYHELKGKTVVVDPERAVAAIFEALEKAGAKILPMRDPTILPKALKNPAEIAGQKAAQTRDGAAIARFLHWIDEEAPKGDVDELKASDHLEALRRENAELRDLSFDSISGAGPNGAIVHYKSSEKTNRKLEKGTLYLIDSGGQYLDGTTDITRTVPIGEPTDEMRDRFTRVLKGHIAIATAVFPKGTRGSQLDSFARRPLWEAGLDYAHGTGHGVGSFLAVHEGPQRISPVGSSQSGGDEPLQAGMIISNEPGYYKTGEYGIRIENLVLVVPREIEGAEKEMLGFETLTFAPIDRRLIDVQMLDAGGADLAQLLSCPCDGEDRSELSRSDLDWLRSACAPIGD